jgi:hypothetical protein
MIILVRSFSSPATSAFATRIWPLAGSTFGQSSPRISDGVRREAGGFDCDFRGDGMDDFRPTMSFVIAPINPPFSLYLAR